MTFHWGEDNDLYSTSFCGINVYCHLTLHTVMITYVMLFNFAEHCHYRQMHVIAVRVRAKVHIQSFLSVRTKRADRTVQQDCVWHGAIPDVLPILSHVCHSSWRVTATVGDHFRLRSGAQSKGMQPMSWIQLLTSFSFYKKIMASTLHFSTNKYCTLVPQNCLHISLNLCMSKHKAILYPLCIIDWGCLTWSCGSYWIFLFSCSLLKLRLCAIYISVLFHLSLVSVLQGVQKGLRPKKDEHRCSKQMMIMLIGYRRVC